MRVAHSKITAQGQVSVPAAVRKKLGVGPGSILEWDADGENVVVRRSARFSSADIHRALFPKQPSVPRSIDELREGIREYVRKRYARH